MNYFKKNFRRRFEQIAILGIWLKLQIIALLLRGIGYRKTIELLSQYPRRRSRKNESLGSVRCVVRRVLRASQIPPSENRNCLRRSIALWWLLRNMYVPSAVLTGVKKTETGHEFHAWVEINGRIVNDKVGVRQQYIPLWSDLNPEDILNKNHSG